MKYLLLEQEFCEIDEPNQIYSELDEERREVRRIEVYNRGLCFAYGEEFGNAAALSPEPFPADPQDLAEKGKSTVTEISIGVFSSAWETARGWSNSEGLNLFF